MATLKVTGELGDTVTLEFEEGDGFPTSGEAGTAGLAERFREGLATPDDLQRILPFEVDRAIRQWFLRRGTPRPPARVGGVLAVAADGPGLEAVPWELLPDILSFPDLCVVRVPARPIRPAEAKAGGSALLAAGWIGAPTLNLPGIRQELTALADLGDADEGATVRVIAEPTVADLRRAWSELRPACLHIAAPALQYGDDGPVLAISGTDEIELVPLETIIAGMEEAGTACVLLNTCDGAFAEGRPSAARILAERLRTIAVSWYGKVGDLDAVDFARFFYSRILDGDTAVEALVAFNGIRSVSRPTMVTRGLGPAPRPIVPVPVLWAPAVSVLFTPVFPGRSRDDPRRRPRRRAAHAHAEDVSAPELHIDFEPQRWLNPALLKNLRPAITRLVLDPDRPLDCVSIAVSCDAGVGQSVVHLTMDLERGPQPIATDDLHFPILYQLIDGAATRRRVNFTMRCTHHGQVLAETTRSVLWMGISEWLDREDTWHFIPAFVDPNADGVLRVLDEGSALLKKLVAPTSAFDGYQTGDRDYVRRQAEAIFNCLRDDPFALTYINVPPLEVYLPGDAIPTGQRVRTPTEVIDRRRGTCHDLAVLVASCLEHIGIDPLILLKPGHTFAAYWTDHDAHDGFWKRARADTLRLPQTPGRHWIIRSFEELRGLVDAGHVVLLEATEVTNRNARFDDALVAGRRHLSRADDFDVAVDVRASRYSIQPL